MIHLRNRKLEAGIYSNSYILPYNLLGTPCLGGVSLGDGRYVKDSTWTEWDDLTAYGFNKSNVEYVDRTAIYIGVMMSILGTPSLIILKNYGSYRVKKGRNY